MAEIGSVRVRASIEPDPGARSMPAHGRFVIWRAKLCEAPLAAGDLPLWLPRGARLLGVDLVADQCFVHALVDRDAPGSTRRILVVARGQGLYELPPGAHLGIVTGAATDYHFFDLGEERPREPAEPSWVCTRCEETFDGPGDALRHDCRNDDFQQMRKELELLRNTAVIVSANLDEAATRPGLKDQRLRDWVKREQRRLYLALRTIGAFDRNQAVDDV